MTALHILHITRAELLPPWWNEWQLQQIAADNGCEAVVLDTTSSVEIAPWDVIADWLTEAEADHADWLDEKRTQESDYPR